MSKRERGINFTRDECDKLVNIVHQYKHILENKKSDAEIWKEKEAAWKDIETKFNSSSTAFRPSKTLKYKFDGLKRSVRQKMDLIWEDMHQTDGGPSSAVPLDATEVMIKDIICLSTQGTTNNFGNDASTLDNPNEITLSTEDEYMEVLIKQEDDLCLDSQPFTSTATEHTVSATEVPALEDLAPEDPSSDRQPWDNHLSSVRQSVSGVGQAVSGVRQRAVSEASRRLREERRELLSLHRALMLEEYTNKRKLNEERREFLNLQKTLIVEEYDDKRRLRKLEDEYLKLKLKKLQE